MCVCMCTSSLVTATGFAMIRSILYNCLCDKRLNDLHHRYVVHFMVSPSPKTTWNAGVTCSSLPSLLFCCCLRNLGVHTFAHTPTAKLSMKVYVALSCCFMIVSRCVAWRRVAKIRQIEWPRVIACCTLTATAPAAQQAMEWMVTDNWRLQ